MSDTNKLTPQERELALDPSQPLTLEQMQRLCGQTGARVDDELWWEVLNRTGQITDATHPLQITLLQRLARSLDEAGFPVAARRIDELVAHSRSRG